MMYMCAYVPAESCPDGTAESSCLPNPCSTATCPNIPDASCVPNFCGGCFAHFFDEDGINVTTRCQADACPDGTFVALCLADPCVGKTCPEYLEATCVPNYCGGCNHMFVDAGGRDVTGECTRCKFNTIMLYYQS